MIFKVENGNFTYPKGDRQVLKDVSFSVGPGDILAILGPNGAGKTTLLRCALGLLKWKSGGSYLDDKDISSMNSRIKWQHMAYVPQAKQVVSSYSVQEMILLGRSSRIGTFSTPGKADLAMTRDLMEMLGIEKLRDKKCSQISGGELQMVLIARALAAEPEVLILDEPESNLDFRNQLLVLDTMSKLAAEGMTCIFNTHYPAHALRRANKAFMLSRDGTFISGAASRVVTEQSIERIFGVKAVIGDIETDENIFQDVVPISVSGGHGSAQKEDMADNQQVIACLSVILPDRTASERINSLIRSVSPWIIGRMGMPHPELGFYMINLVLDGPKGSIQQLTDSLNLIPGISVKATYSPREKS